MADFDTPKISTEQQQDTPTVPKTSGEVLDQAKQDKHALLAKIDHPELTDQIKAIGVEPRYVAGLNGSDKHLSSIIEFISPGGSLGG